MSYEILPGAGAPDMARFSLSERSGAVCILFSRKMLGNLETHPALVAILGNSVQRKVRSMGRVPG